MNLNGGLKLLDFNELLVSVPSSTPFFFLLITELCTDLFPISPLLLVILITYEKWFFFGKIEYGFIEYENLSSCLARNRN